MSKGHGRVERRILEILGTRAQDGFAVLFDDHGASATEVAAIIFDCPMPRVSAAQRASVARALGSLARKGMVEQILDINGRPKHGPGGIQWAAKVDFAKTSGPPPSNMKLPETIPAAERRRLVQLLGMLGSEHDGERATAGRMADDLLRRHGLTWADLLSK